MNRHRIGGLAMGLMAACAALPAAGQSLALGPDSDAPIEILADDGIEWQRSNQLYIARGNAKATQGEVTVAADSLTAFYRTNEAGENQIYRLDADGDVRITSTTEEALAEKAVYDVLNGVLVLTGQTITLNTADDVITARDSMEYYQQDQLAIARGDAVATRGDRQVQADVLMAHFADAADGDESSSVERIESVGNVLISTPTDIVRAAQGDYVPDSGIATLQGDVKITRGENQLNGEFAEVDLNTGISRLSGGPSGDGRVGGLILPSATKGEE